MEHLYRHLHQVNVTLQFDILFFKHQYPFFTNNNSAEDIILQSPVNIFPACYTMLSCFHINYVYNLFTLIREQSIICHDFVNKIKWPRLPQRANNSQASGAHGRALDPTPFFFLALRARPTLFHLKFRMDMNPLMI